MKPQCAVSETSKLITLMVNLPGTNSFQHYGKTNHKDHEKEQAAQTGLKTDGTAKIDNQVKQNQPFRRSALNVSYLSDESGTWFTSSAPCIWLMLL